MSETIDDYIEQLEARLADRTADWKLELGHRDDYRHRVETLEKFVSFVALGICHAAINGEEHHGCPIFVTGTYACLPHMARELKQ